MKAITNHIDFSLTIVVLKVWLENRKRCLSQGSLLVTAFGLTDVHIKLKKRRCLNDKETDSCWTNDVGSYFKTSSIIYLVICKAKQTARNHQNQMCKVLNEVVWNLFTPSYHHRPLISLLNIATSPLGVVICEIW